MKDIPMFTTENGAAGLTLQEIPYNRKAYITIYDTQDLPALLQECADFCKAVGAEEIFACGHNELSSHQVYTQILEMECCVANLLQTDAATVPVTKDTLTEFVEIYNRKMGNIPAAAYLSRQRAQALFEQGSCYFIYRNETMLGIGVVAEGVLSAVASLVPGGGKDAVLALCKTSHTDRVRLEVASKNQKAIRLYETLGFTDSGIKNVWYKIL